MSRTTRWASVALATLALSALAAPAGAAPRALSDDGLWYFEALSVGDAHEAGLTGEGVTIAVLDSPINPDVPTLQGADIEYYDSPLCYLDDEGKEPVPSTSDALDGVLSASHGTNVVSYLVGSGKGYAGQTGVKGVAPGAKILAYAMPTSDEPDRLGSLACKRPGVEDIDGPSKAFAEVVDDAIDRGADIISVSLEVVPDQDTDRAFARAIREGVVVVGALDNSNDISIAPEYPGTGNGAVSVQAIDSDVNVATSNGATNTNSATDIVAPGVGVLLQGAPDGDWQQQRLGGGTSYATPIVAGFLAVVKQKYPEATGNQLIQTLIHNTGRDDGEAVYDENEEYGYGTASLTVMLTADPTQYDDENPLINDLQLPDREFIENGADVEPTTAPTPGPSSSLPSLILTAALIVGALILIGVVVLVIVLVTRRSRRSALHENRS